MAEHAARTGESPSPERLEALVRLAKLVDMRAAATAPSGRNWRAASVLGGTLVIVSVLLFVRVRSTDIELDLQSSQAQFVLSGEQVLTGTVTLPTLGISGVEEIRLPRDRRHDARLIPGAPRAAIRLTASSDGKRPGSVTLAPLTPPDGTRVTIRPTELANEYRLSIAGNPVTLRADIEGPMAAIANAAPETLDVPSPTSVVLRAGTEETDLDLTLPSGRTDVLWPQLKVRGLAFHLIDESAGAEGTLLRHISTILSGTLYLESLNGTEHRLRPGEPLQFEDSRGLIRVLRLGDNRVGLQFHGVVRGMSTGLGEGRRSLMPTYLEWLRARHGLLLLWGAVLYAYGLINRALHWWGLSM